MLVRISTTDLLPDHGSGTGPISRQGGEPPQPGDELPGRHHRDGACDRRGKQDVVMDLHFC